MGFGDSNNLLVSVIIFVFMATSHSIHSNKPMAISVSLFRNLPPDIDRPFNVTVNFSSYHKINSAFIVYLVNKSETPPKMMQNFIFRPGSQTKIKGFIIGEYFSVVHCLSKTEEKQLKLDLILHEKAQNLVLLMFYSMNYKENATNNNGTEIYQSVISCNVSYLVDMKLVFGKSHVNEEAFPPNQLIWINCSASIEHQPYWKSVRLENLDQMEVFDVKINNRTKETSILAEITLKNHDSLIVCRSVNSTISRRIKIYHHPTSVKTSPSVASRSSIPYNVSITCVTTGGYPPPIVEWKLIIGPLNASRYYTLNKNKTVLVITKKAPPGSKWIFQCFAKNKLPWSEFSGPEMIVSFNIPELGLEARKKVFFVIPVAIIFLLFLVTVLKVHFCKQGKVLQKSKQLDWNMKSKTFEKNELKFLKTDEVFTEHLEMASDITSTTYSIEKGLTAQTFYVLDESRYDIEERLPSKKSLKDTQSWIDSIESEKDAIQI